MADGHLKNFIRHILQFTRRMAQFITIFLKLYAKDCKFVFSNSHPI
ncbi:MAG TPA: hypothetical protein VM010_00785 [Chitinophagaceae bacterium]|nr:hypothetical protein [Chitinophagaceae bacterium]